MIGQSAHGCFGSKHSPVPGASDWSDFSDTTPCRGTALHHPDWPRAGYEGGVVYTSHPFTLGPPSGSQRTARTGRRSPEREAGRARGRGGTGRGGRKSLSGKPGWTFPPPSTGSVRAEEGHRLLLRGEGGRSPTQVRRP